MVHKIIYLKTGLVKRVQEDDPVAWFSLIDGQLEPNVAHVEQGGHGFCLLIF